MNELIPKNVLNMPPPQRVKWLRANADKVKMEPVFEPVDADVRAELNSRLSELALEQHRIEKEKKEILDDFKERLKPIKTDMKDTLEVLNAGGESVDKEVYLMADHESNKMITFDESGRELRSRMLLQNERQGTIHSEMRSVSGGNEL